MVPCRRGVGESEASQSTADFGSLLFVPGRAGLGPLGILLFLPASELPFPTRVEPEKYSEDKDGLSGPNAWQRRPDASFCRPLASVAPDQPPDSAQQYSPWVSRAQPPWKWPDVAPTLAPEMPKLELDLDFDLDFMRQADWPSPDSFP